MSEEFDAAEKRLEEGHPVGRHASCGILGHYYDPCDIRLLLDKVRELGEEIERLTKHRGLLPNVGAGQMLNPCVCQACLERRAREAEAELAAERERVEKLRSLLEANIPPRTYGSLQEEVDFLRRDVASLQANKHNLITRLAAERERSERLKPESVHRRKP